MTPRQGRAFRAAVGWAVLLAVAGDPARAGLRDLEAAWLLDPPAIVRVLAEPGGADRGWWVGVGQMRLYGLPELPVTAVRGSIRLPGPGLPWTLGGGWQRTGRGLAVEDDVEAVLELGRSPRVGFRWCGRRWSVTDYPAWSHGELQGRIGWGDGRPWSVAATVQLTAPAPWRSGTEPRPLVRLRWTGRGAGVAVGLDLDGDGRPHVGAELMASPGGATGLGLRADPSTGTLGLTLVWLGPGLMVRTSHLVHPDLGLTHRVQLGFGRPGAAHR